MAINTYKLPADKILLSSEIAYGDKTLKQTLDKILADQKVLWTGGYYMTSGHTANLSEKISEQKNGIVLVWSAFSSGSSQNYWFSYYFIPKQHIALFPGLGVCVPLMEAGFSAIACKYVYVNDQSIVGNDSNNKTGTSSGISYKNNQYVLRAVIGV